MKIRKSIVLTNSHSLAGSSQANQYPKLGFCLHGCIKLDFISIKKQTNLDWFVDHFLQRSIKLEHYFFKEETLDVLYCIVLSLKV